jgi:hypothetical protein
MIAMSPAGRVSPPSAEEVSRWFDLVLVKVDEKPTIAAYNQLAGKLQLIRDNQSLNEEWLRHAKGQKLRPLMEAAGQLLAEINKLGPNFQAAPLGRGTITWDEINEIRSMLLSLGASSPVKTAAGRPRENWHRAAPRIASAILEAMSVVKYSGSMNKLDENGVIAVVGAEVINWYYNPKSRIKPSGFVSALKRRDRKNKQGSPQTFDERYPRAKEIEVIPPNAEPN